MDIKKLTKQDMGRWVTYHSFEKEERGRIKSWNDKWIFVVYKCDQNWGDYRNYAACATRPEDLDFSQLQEDQDDS